MGEIKFNKTNEAGTKMRVTYVKHSSFVVELDRHILIFDYYLEGKLPELDNGKQILVFTSHKHADHFNVQILRLAEKYENIHFFLGAGLRLNEKYLQKNGIEIDRDAFITNVYKRQILDYEDVHIRTLRSTDAGVAFLINCEGKCIYHAGDLNCWCWEAEGEEYNEKMKNEYESEINQIKGECIDAAFVPLDPHLENTYWMGMDFFLRTTDTKYAFPMHMWGDYGVIDRYIENEGKDFSDKIMRINNEGHVFDFV